MKKLKKWTTLLAVAMFVMLVIPQWTLSVSATEVSGGAENGNIASGRNNDIEWVIDANGKLTISGSGNFTYPGPETDGWWSISAMPWSRYAKNVKSAVVHVTDMTDARFLFSGCENLTDVDLSGLDMSKITRMNYMFAMCKSLSSLDLGGFDTSNVVSMEGMFSNCSGLSSLDVSKFNTSKVTRMNQMFRGCSRLFSLDVSRFDTSKVTSMDYMFEGCENLSGLDLRGFDTSKVTSMNGMFSECKNLTDLDLSRFDTSKVKVMAEMFYGCESLFNLDVSTFDTSQVQSMYGMFENCKSLSSLDLSGFNTSNLTSVDCIVRNCSNLVSLNLSSFDMSFEDPDKIKDGDIDVEFFKGCDKLAVFYTPYNLTYFIELPGSGWHLMDGTEITELSLNLSNSVKITTLPLDMIEDEDNDNKDNNNQSSSSGVLEGTGSTADSAIYGKKLLTANPTNFKTILLNWDAVPGAKSYEIFYSTSPDSGFKRLANVKKTSYKFSKAKCGVTYYFQMRVCKKGGVKSEFGPISYGKTDLSSSSALQVKKTTYNSVTLKWSKVTGAKKYEIYYADSMDGDWQYLGVKSGTSFTHKRLVTGATYYYQVRPVRDAFYGNWSNGVSATTILNNVSNLKVKAAGTDRLKLTWKKVRGVNQYVIKRAERIDGDYEVIGYSNKASYIDTGLKSGTTYFYKVSAVSGPYRTKDTDPVGQTTKIPK